MSLYVYRGHYTRGLSCVFCFCLFFFSLSCLTFHISICLGQCRRFVFLTFFFFIVCVFVCLFCSRHWLCFIILLIAVLFFFFLSPLNLNASARHLNEPQFPHNSLRKLGHKPLQQKKKKQLLLFLFFFFCSQKTAFSVFSPS